MKIAFISYEYPPDTAVGGIATYVSQAAQMLRDRGHQVEVFTASTIRSGTVKDDGITVHRIRISQRDQFAVAIAPCFTHRHQEVEFDVLEGPDFGSDAAIAVKQNPTLPFVLKLHTPHYIISETGSPFCTWKAETRRILGALRRRQSPLRRQSYDYRHDTEYQHALAADRIAAPSIAIAHKLQVDWRLPVDAFSITPLPFIPNADLLHIPVATQTQRITFIGRLEIRKGVLDLANAIPHILRKHPGATFRFIGASLSSPEPTLTMRQYLEKQLYPYRHAIEFTDSVPPRRIPGYLADTDICVFPSIWESFGFVCLESMMAARGVVASGSGGMAELLNYGECGHLIPPRSPRKMATAICNLLAHPEKRMQLGQLGRDRALTHYNGDRIGEIQEECYSQAIERKQLLLNQHNSNDETSDQHHYLHIQSPSRVSRSRSLCTMESKSISHSMGTADC